MRIEVYKMMKMKDIYKAQQNTVVASSISSGEDYGIHCRWGLIRSKQLSSVPGYRA